MHQKPHFITKAGAFYCISEDFIVFLSHSSRGRAVKPMYFTQKQIREMKPSIDGELVLEAPSFENDSAFTAFCEKLPQFNLKKLTLTKLFLKQRQWDLLLNSLKNCKALTELNLSHNNPDIEDFFAKLLLTLPLLRHLEVYNVKFSEKGKAKLVDAISSHPTILELWGIDSLIIDKYLSLNKIHREIDTYLQELTSFIENPDLIHLVHLETIEEELNQLFASEELTKVPQRKEDALCKSYYLLGQCYNLSEEKETAHHHFREAATSNSKSHFKALAIQELASLCFTEASKNPNVLNRIALLEEADDLLSAPASSEDVDNTSSSNLPTYNKAALLTNYENALAELHKKEGEINLRKAQCEAALKLAPAEVLATASRFDKKPEDSPGLRRSLAPNT